jgi:hypothetical protein
MGPLHGGLRLVLPTSVSEAVRAEFGRHCQHLDESLTKLTSSKEQLALVKFSIAHLSAQATLIQLAQGDAGD